jgi:hypothetical protein
MSYLPELIYSDIEIGDTFIDRSDDTYVIIDGMPEPHMFSVGVWSKYNNAYHYENNKVHISNLVSHNIDLQ